LLSQSPKPDLHAIEQRPFEQLGVPLILLQILEQSPQCCVSVSALISQPFAGAESQSLNDPEQLVTWQVPAVHCHTVTF
jgi:hypothetical protein